MNPMTLLLLALLLMALFDLRSLERKNKLLTSDKQYAWDQVVDRNNRLIALSNKYDRLLGEKAQGDFDLNKARENSAILRTELRRKQRKVGA